VSRKRKRQRKKQTFEDVPLTPMIDVVFQMLIYFVLTFEIPDKMSQMQVWRPAGDSPPQADSTPPLNVARITVYDGYYAYNDTRASLGTLERTFNRLADLNPTQSIIVVATADSRHGSLVDALDLLNKAGLENVSLLSSN